MQLTDKPVLTFEGWGVMPKHIEGPWDVVRGKEDGFSWEQMDRIMAGDMTIARMPVTRTRKCIANARLLATAPDMLALLEEVAASELPLWSVFREDVVRVIAKAKGETIDR